MSFALLKMMPSLPAALGLTLFSMLANAQDLQIIGVYNTLGEVSLCPAETVFAFGNFPVDSSTTFAVTVNGETAPIHFVASSAGIGNEVAFVIPMDIPAGPATVVISHLGTPSNAFPIRLTATCPAIIAGGGPGSAFSHTNGAPVTNAFPAAPGETINVVLAGLGATNPVQALGTSSSSPLPAAITPVVEVGGIAAKVTFAGQTSTTVGNGYFIEFTVPSSAPAGADTVVVTSGGATANLVQLPVGTVSLPPAPSIAAVVNGASYSQKGAAPGSFLTLFVSGLTGPEQLSAFPSTQVNGVSVEIGGELAPISSLIPSQGQINVLVPSDLSPYGTLPVTILSNNGSSAGSAVGMAIQAPGIFLVSDPSDSSRHAAAALFANTAWYVMSTSQAAALGLPSCTGLSKTAICGQPAQPGDYIELFVTGLGVATANGAATGTPLATGQVPPDSGSPLYQPVSAATLTVNDVATPVLSAAVAPGFAGLYQVNFQVPAATASGDASIQLTGVLSISLGSSVTDTAVIAIQ